MGAVPVTMVGGTASAAAAGASMKRPGGPAVGLADVPLVDATAPGVALVRTPRRRVGATPGCPVALLRRPQVGRLHRRVGLDGGRVARGDDSPVVEHGHVVADAHHEAHVVLDEQDGHAPAGEVGEDPSELEGLLVVQTRARLVQQEQRRCRGQGARQLGQPGQPGRQQVARLVGHVGQPDVAEQDVGFGARARPGRLALPRLRRHLHVLARRQRAEELEALEGPGDPQASPVMWARVGDVHAVEHQPPPDRRLQPRDHVEERGLARPVRADQAVHGAGADLDGDVLQRLDAAEGHRHLLHLELSQPSSPRSARRARAPAPGACPRRPRRRGPGTAPRRWPPCRRPAPRRSGCGRWSRSRSRS